MVKLVLLLSIFNLYAKFFYSNLNIITCYNNKFFSIFRGIKGNFIIQHFTFNEPFQKYHKYHLAEVS